MKEISNPITKRILQELDKQNKSVYQLCHAVGMHQGTFSNTKKNKNSWRQAIQFHKIADFLNVSEKLLITGIKTQFDENQIIENLRKENTRLTKELVESKKKIRVLTTTIVNLTSDS